jgi:hypothetical protein
MAKKSRLITYKRDKNKVEISGDLADVKWLVWFDLLSSRLFWIVAAVALSFIALKVSFMAMIWQWITKGISFLILFAAIAGASPLLLSG